ncbi:MAG TPA: hypothetical protein DCO82_06280, partial [Alphaproteobacteria bacterium]|nr:hypothetical protein [Alphaproteobacteria bacterium]
WALMLTGNLLELGERKADHLWDRLGRLAARLGEGAVRQAIKAAIRIMSGQFVFAQTIEAAVERLKSFPLEARFAS